MRGEITTSGGLTPNTSLSSKNQRGFQANWHAADKSEAIAKCKEMPVIPVNKMGDKKKII
jgi:hypothetical protein